MQFHLLKMEQAERQEQVEPQERVEQAERQEQVVVLGHLVHQEPDFKLYSILVITEF